MFGFPIDNTIGGTSQPNGWMDNWVDFYRERRLGHQLKLTKDPNLQKLGKKLCDNLEKFFEGIEVGSSINFFVNQENESMLAKPATPVVRQQTSCMTSAALTHLIDSCFFQTCIN